MNHKIRLGPIAVFLAVIAAVVATLAMLTFATSRADAALAERFAAVTSIRYALDEEGNRFLQSLETMQENEEERTSTAEVHKKEGALWIPSVTETGGEDKVEEFAAEKTAAGELSGEITPVEESGWRYYTEKDQCGQLRCL